MKHLGDITKINGAEIPPVDCICGGSPCQDLSVAGLRNGLSGERSGLFMEMIRVTKEIREKEIQDGRTDESIRPRYLVWENVHGAMSSNSGRDFQAVLTEVVKIVKADAPNVPMPDKGKWQKCGSICGVGDNGQPFSVAYKLVDAQYYGTPQRRKRICLLADFNGLTAPWILFDPKFKREAVERESVQTVRGTGVRGREHEEVSAVCEGVSGNPAESRESRKGIAGYPTGSIGEASR